MKRALIIGASGGIGSAIASELQNRGLLVDALSRSTNGLDVTDEQSIRAAFAPLDTGYDLVFVASGALQGAGNSPEKSIKALEAAAMADQFAVNCIGPALVLKHAIRLMPRDRRSVFAALSARVGSIGDNRLGGWYSYRAAKAALNQVIHTGAIELARTHPEALCVALHPGTVATDFTANYAGRHPTVAPAEAAQNLLAVLDGLTPDQSGQFFDWAGKSVPW
jgi:NAD(P)-dependent dehydrogenase (short-subunit alcohol dehydrogenase family)